MSDPFEAPTKVVSQFASIQSFQGRLVLISPTKLELQIPSAEDPSKLQDRITADVMTVDGKGKVEIFSRRVGTGQFLPGPEHRGIWIGQERLVQQLRQDGGRGALKGMVLGTIDTWKGGPAGRGNPWEIRPASEADKQMAREFLANRTVGAASDPLPAPAQSAPAEVGEFVPSGTEKNPFG